MKNYHAFLVRSSAAGNFPEILTALVPRQKIISETSNGRIWHSVTKPRLPSSTVIVCGRERCNLLLIAQSCSLWERTVNGSITVLAATCFSRVDHRSVFHRRILETGYRFPRVDQWGDIEITIRQALFFKCVLSRLSRDDVLSVRLVGFPRREGEQRPRLAPYVLSFVKRARLQQSIGGPL